MGVILILLLGINRCKIRGDGLMIKLLTIKEFRKRCTEFFDKDFSRQVDAIKEEDVDCYVAPKAEEWSVMLNNVITDGIREKVRTGSPLTESQENYLIKLTSESH